MGAWGHGTFENDTAMDWTYELEACSDLSILEETIAAGGDFSESEEEMDADTACTTLAAAEVIAAMQSKPNSNLPDTVTSWIQGKPKAPPELIKAASLAVSTLLEKSELKELWAETEENADWVAAVQDLLRRLQ